MKRNLLYYIFILTVVVIGSSSCISSEETNYLQNIAPADINKYKWLPFEEYRLAVRDNISCKISTTDEETRSLFSTIITSDPSMDQGIGLTIYEDSTVIIPFFGTIKIAGLTIQEAEMKIQDMMKESILDAQVKISLLSNVFYIYANEKQGQYRVYKENMTIYQALAISGQTTEKMDISKVKIVRKGDDGQDIIKEFDLRTQDVIESQFYYIKPNDVIYFSTNKNAFFNITSVSSFINMVMVPLTTLFIVSTYRF